ncbi:serine hydrolase domain-containing protein [Paenibacillus glacialis]|uniref:Beta-lactamase-related domain-containing protein n=1 Tax=Paenibacillus glacialis TaxID=494026 RepID=A0A162LXV0_9BACL|nr:serine hydrolase domain-containing protein [Paenibacillus glacialis]OAB41507.1 hypothetical protein PGLA_17080 [Paenibacillus glacialis]
MKIVRGSKVLFCLLIFSLLVSNMSIYVSAEETEGVQKRLETVMDGYMNMSMEDNHIAGASLVVVKDGKVLLKKGYGYADVASQTPFDPNQTLSRIGSVTKLFTATAAMQLVENGEIDLDADVNTYLKNVKIDNPYDTLLSMKHLLTQTGGFAESTEGIYSDKLLERPVPLSDTIGKYMPPLVRRPGEVIQYSNYGYALIGYIVEQVSGISYGQYIQDHLFKPLGMTGASYDLSPELLSELSKGYAYDGKKFIEKSAGSILVYPAGSIVATAEDMSKFLLIHLQNGATMDGRILNESTAKSMREVHFTAHAAMPGYGYGFYQNYKNTDILMHDGDVDSYTSQLSIYPKENLGYFLTYNTLDDGALRDGVEEEIYNFFGVDMSSKVKPEVTEAFSDSSSAEPKAYEGKYVFAQRVLKGPLRSRGLFLKMGISTDKDGNVKLSTFDSSVSGTYVESADGTYVKPGTNRRIALKEDPEGNQYLLVNMKTPLQTMEKLSSKEVFMESIVRPYVFGIALIGCIIAFFQLFRRKKRKRLEGGALRARRLSQLLSLLIVLLGLVMVVVMFTQSDDFRATIVIVGYLISGLIALAFIGLLLTLLSLLRNKDGGSIWNLAFSTMVMLAGAGSLVYAAFLDMY